MIPFIKLRPIWYSLSTALMLLSILGVAVRGIPYGIDFTGGSLLEVAYTKEAVTTEQINEALQKSGISNANVQRAGERGYVLRMSEIDDETHSKLLAELRGQIGQTSVSPSVDIESESGLLNIGDLDVTFDSPDGSEDSNAVIERRFDTVGPVIGQELKTKSVQALILVLLAIMAYVAWAFRKISWPVRSWKYGAVAVLALFHDVIITFGAFVWAASFFGWEVDTVFIAALLTVLGYSVNDTIIVFDRVRENLPRMNESFEGIVNASVNQTMGRSINTTFTTLLVLFAILFFGGETLRPFMFALIVGIFLGAYSSIFIASPLLVTLQLRAAKVSAK